VKFFIYARKSTEDEARQILSIDAQLDELRMLAGKERLDVAHEYLEAQTARRPRPATSLAVLRAGRSVAQSPSLTAAADMSPTDGLRGRIGGDSLRSCEPPSWVMSKP